MAHLHDIAGGFVIRVVGKKHQNVKCRLRQLQFLTQRLADGIVRLRGLDRKFYVRVHAEPSSLFFHF